MGEGVGFAINHEQMQCPLCDRWVSRPNHRRHVDACERKLDAPPHKRYRVTFDVVHTASIEISASDDEMAARKAFAAYRKDPAPFTENWWLDIRPSAGVEEIRTADDNTHTADGRESGE